jgi:hypothetical protein
MPIFASNFASNSLSGTARVVNGFANITLPTIPYALEGDKTFVIKIRKDSITGDVLSTSPVLTFRDNSSFVSLTANVSSVAEGNLVAFTLVTANAVNGANLFYSVFPVTANVTAGDFTANTGTFTITNNAGTFALRANADVSLSNEDGETFRVQLRTTDSVGNVVFTTSNVVILDTYKTYNVLSFVESSASPLVEGSNVTFTFTATNIPNGTVLYYNTSGNTTNFFSNTGSFVMNGTSNTFVISNPQVPTNASRTYNVVVRDGSAQGTIVATSNTMVVLDGGLVYMAATGGTITDSGGYRVHTFTSSGNLVITNAGLNPSYSYTNYLIVGGTGGDGYGGSGGDFGGGGGGGGGVVVGNVDMSIGTVSITIGADGARSGSMFQQGPNGSNTLVSAPFIPYSIYALGGGGGGSGGYPSTPYGSIRNGLSGGSGGGGYQGGGGGAATKPSITNATTYGNSGGGSSEGWGNGGGGGSSSSSGFGSDGVGGSGEPSYYGQPAPANPGKGGWAGRGFNGAPSGFPGGPFGAGRAGLGSGSTYETVGVGKALFKYPYVAGPTFTSITSSTNFGAVAGSNVILTLNTLNLSNNSVLYYSTVGNVISSDFVSGNTGSFRSTGNATTITLATNSNIPERFFQLQLNLDGIGEAAAITSNVITIRPPVTFSAETLAIGGGGSGAGGAGNAVGGSGGGAGGLILTNVTISSGTNYTISVPGSAAGGTYPATRGNDGSNTILSGGSISITAVGGAAGISQNNSNRFGRNGGSGSGGRFEGGTPTASLSGGNGYGFPSPTQQGYPGGTGTGTFPGFQGGGGGAGGEGTPGVSNGYGGLGIYSLITGANVQYAGGGGGGSLFPGQQGGAGQFGGGSGFAGAGGAANVNTGGGGGGAGRPGGSDETVGGAGGSGIVVLAYPNTLPNVFVVSGNVQISTNTTSRPGYLVHRIIGGTGTITFL